jgi:hypothetical protein
MLNRRRRERLADAREIGLALRALSTRHPYLEQLVAVEVDLDLVQHRLAESLVADRHHRLEAMSARLQRLALGRRNHPGHEASKVRRYATVDRTRIHRRAGRVGPLAPGACAYP